MRPCGQCLLSTMSHLIGPCSPEATDGGRWGCLVCRSMEFLDIFLPSTHRHRPPLPSTPPLRPPRRPSHVCLAYTLAVDISGGRSNVSAPCVYVPWTDTRPGPAKDVHIRTKVVPVTTHFHRHKSIFLPCLPCPNVSVMYALVYSRDLRWCMDSQSIGSTPVAHQSA